MNKNIRFIDLFAGIGGLRLGFEQACSKSGFSSECVLTSEIKPHALKVLNKNFEKHNSVGDIFNVTTENIPDFDFLLAGFPCQPFSAGGKRLGFVDTRGTLFFEIERILKDKNPYGFILENVEGLVKHDLENKNDKIGRTLNVILYKLSEELGYKVNWGVIDAREFGLPQSRKRVFIVGTKHKNVSLNGYEPVFKNLNSILEKGLETLETDFVKKLTSHFSINELRGKSIKDKRGGENNIHSWDIELKGKISDEQKLLLSKLFKERRRKKWAEEIGIDWMDGMPLTLEQIKSFCDLANLKEKLDDLVEKGYLKFEFPKSLVVERTSMGIKKYRVPDPRLKRGYNIVTGKLSFEVNKVLDPDDIAPTLVATDVERIVVPDGDGLRQLTIREGLRLFGFPEWFEMPVTKKEAFDLLGNTVAVPVVENVSKNVVEAYKTYLISSFSPVYSE
jgi:DNA (cytosine-5)-methyltransferase 1